MELQDIGEKVFIFVVAWSFLSTVMMSLFQPFGVNLSQYMPAGPLITNLPIPNVGSDWFSLLYMVVTTLLNVMFGVFTGVFTVIDNIFNAIAANIPYAAASQFVSALGIAVAGFLQFTVWYFIITQIVSFFFL
jgi:hypothetical protein